MSTITALRGPLFRRSFNIIIYVDIERGKHFSPAEMTIHLSRTMINKLRNMAIFAAVVEQGAFRSAARELGLAPSRISQAVSDLEAELGVTLLYRSTRRLSLTNEGRILFAEVSAMLRAAETGLNAISALSEEPTGELRVTAPAFIVQTDLLALIAQFSKKYPKVDLNLSFTDHVASLIDEGHDVSIRARSPKNDDTSRKISEIKRFLVASPDYCRTKDAPEHPSDLEDWAWIRFQMRADRTDLTLPDGETVTVVGKSHVTVDAATALYELSVQGLGLTELPENLARRAIARGELIHVLPQWSLRPLGIYAIWADSSRRTSLAQLFVRHLVQTT